MARLRRGTGQNGESEDRTRRCNEPVENVSEEIGTVSPKHLRGSSSQSTKAEAPTRLIPKTSTPIKHSRQVHLAPLRALGSPYPVVCFANESHTRPVSQTRSHASTQRTTTLGRRKVATSAILVYNNDEDRDKDLPGSGIKENVWCGSDYESDSDISLPSPEKVFRLPRKARGTDRGKYPNSQQHDLLTIQLQALSIPDDRDISPEKRLPPTSKLLNRRLSSVSTSDKENDAFVQISPRHLNISRRRNSSERPTTPPPPPSPSKPKLVSPSKTNPGIPIGSLRPSLDAFWTAETSTLR